MAIVRSRSVRSADSARQMALRSLICKIQLYIPRINGKRLINLVDVNRNLRRNFFLYPVSERVSSFSCHCLSLCSGHQKSCHSAAFSNLFFRGQSDTCSDTFCGALWLRLHSLHTYFLSEFLRILFFSVLLMLIRPIFFICFIPHVLRLTLMTLERQDSAALSVQVPCFQTVDCYFGCTSLNIIRRIGCLK